MKKIFLLFLTLAFLGLGPPSLAQGIPASANLTAQDSGACTTANACLTVNLPNGSASSVLQFQGTWSATVQFEGSSRASILDATVRSRMAVGFL